jgi:hypothetical protein
MLQGLRESTVVIILELSEAPSSDMGFTVHCTTEDLWGLYRFQGLPVA